MVRITTNGVLRGYRSNLMRSSNNLNTARDKVLTQRNFNSFAEDPAAATQAFQLRRSASSVSDQYNNSNNLYKKYDQAYQSMFSTIDKVGSEALSGTLAAIDDSKGSARNQLGSQLTELSKTIVQNMNVRYGSTYVFAGADGQNIPFTWGTNGELQYRGIDVNTTDPDELAKLKQMAQETVYVDVGYGMQEDGAGNIVSASAANAAISGVKFLGFGTTADPTGDMSNNYASVVKELGEIFSRCDKDTGKWASDADKERATALSKQFQTIQGRMTSAHVELDVQSKALKENTATLKDTYDMLNEQILSIEQVDLADAISSFSWAQYCYNAALKVGNSILTESLIDYMR